ncbi:hypothetical protein AB0J94_28980 [Micromonospora noduli]|uniref:Uncharacterized protein n=1 Tax=Micromonospora noduli TaxID=709876 RepID=A0ABX9D0C0_9ACTN|nr:hypothetical protein [Micromonospora noduli]RAO13496.1 hypothetical protein LUPAC07_03788 [Micromonospora noduli]RAO16290.1 hypothetical protein MED15_03809 [Micromonospora noduli]RAO19878.1 hypothetical protein GUI43_00515 [Micromonospora noduli]
MAEQGQGGLPPGHRAARLVLLGALLAALAAGVVSPAADGYTRGAWEQAGQVVAYFLAPLRDRATPAPPPTPSPTPAKPKPKPKPTKSRAG